MIHLGTTSRRTFLASSTLGVAAAAFGRVNAAERAAGSQAARPAVRRIPVIDCTDLYHPHQDVGDNFDILLPTDRTIASGSFPT